MSATTGPTNLLASVSCRDDRALYDYMNTRIAPLQGVERIETEPIIRSIKRHATLDPPFWSETPAGSAGGDGALRSGP